MKMSSLGAALTAVLSKRKDVYVATVQGLLGAAFHFHQPYRELLLMAFAPIYCAQVLRLDMIAAKEWLRWDAKHPNALQGVREGIRPCSCGDTLMGMP
jgi:hypothetical protein